MTSRAGIKDRLKRFLYISAEVPRYITGDPEKHKYYEIEKLVVLQEILQSENPELLLNIIDMVNSENLLPRRETIFVALAFAATTTIPLTDTFKHKIYTTLLNVCRGDEDLFTFIKLYSKVKKNFSSALNKAVFTYYTRKDPFDLARDISRQPRIHGWSHKDVLKLAHGKTDSALTAVVLCYVLFGLKKAKEFGADITNSDRILTFLTKAESLRRCELEKNLPALITDIQASVSQVPSYFRKSEEVWEALIPHLELNLTIQTLPLMFKYGFLRSNTPIQTRIIQALTDIDKVKASKIYPEEVFIGIRNFEKGGKPMDPQLKKHLLAKEALNAKNEAKPEQPEKKKETPKCPAIVTALNKTLHQSYANLQPTGKRIMITIEVSHRMENPCLKTKTLSCLEAAIITALAVLKTEREVVVAVFNNNLISPVALEKNATVNKAISKLQTVKSGYVHIPAVFDWAVKKKKNIDVFMNFIYYNHSLDLAPKEVRDKEKPIAALNKYRKKVNLPQTKMVTFSLSSPNLRIADGSPNILDVCGFDSKVPRLVEAFCRGSFC